MRYLLLLLPEHKLIKRITFSAICFICVLINSTSNAQSPYFNSFKTNNTSGITLGGDAKLTSGIEDLPNEGYLRLTPSEPNKRGFAYIDTPFPSTQGLKVEFEYNTWGGNLADGITFFLFDPVDGFEIGQYGGALGYAQNNNNGAGLGLKNGFMAVGLDEYGNFGAATETKNGGFRDFSGQLYNTAIFANGLVTVRGGVGPGKEREGITAYPFLGGKITNNVFGGTVAPWPADMLAAADLFGIATNSRGSIETNPNYRKVRLDIERIPGTGFKINLEVFVGSKARWIKVLENFTYTISDLRVPAIFKAGFSASTGMQFNNHEIRNVLISPSASALLTPIANDDAAITPFNQPVNLAILTNDNTTINSGTFLTGSVDLDPSTVIVESSKIIPGKGTFIVNNTGLLTFTPETGFTGPATVNYIFKDTHGINSDEATVTVTVNTGNSAPTIALIEKTGTEDTPIAFSITDFTSKFNDPELQPLNKIKFTGLPSSGTLKLNAINITVDQEIPLAQLGDITYVPEPNWNGILAPFNWNGSDGTSYAAASAEVKITVTAVNDVPTVAIIEKTGTEDIPVPFTALDFTSKFNDPDLQTLAKIKFSSLPSAGTLKLNGANISLNQEIPLAELGNITFVPQANLNGILPPFNWNGSDGSSYAVSSAEVKITVTAVNDLPTVASIEKTGTEDTPVPFTALDFTSKFNDPELDALTKIKFTSLPSNGTLKLNTANINVNQEISLAQLSDILYIPQANWNGILPSFHWNGSDGISYAVTNAEVKITISEENDAPTTLLIEKTGNEDSPVTFTAADFTSKFIDPDLQALAKIKFTSLPSSGTLKLNATNIAVDQEIPSAQLGNITYVPEPNWNGILPPFNWNGSDGTTYAAASAEVKITITAVNDLPTVAAIEKTGLEDTPVPFTALDFTSKFSDPDLQPLAKIKFSSLPATGSMKLNGTNISLNQEVPLAELGNITFMPQADWNGILPAFNWTGSDGASYAATTAEIKITITAVNDPPTAVNDEKETDLNKAVDILILDNDFADGVILDKGSVVIVVQPKKGTLQINSNGVVTYKPIEKFTGKDSFTYKVKDANGSWSNEATVSLTVNGFVMTNIFTPNGDGKNDTFVIVGLENYDSADLTVFNRWGNEVYRNVKYDNAWEGNGLNSGTYFFMVKLKKGSTENVHKGWVLLKR